MPMPMASQWCGDRPRSYESMPMLLWLPSGMVTTLEVTSPCLAYGFPAALAQNVDAPKFMFEVDAGKIALAAAPCRRPIYTGKYGKIGFLIKMESIKPIMLRSKTKDISIIYLLASFSDH